MISLICYWIWLCWDITSDKLFWAVSSTIEFGIEIALIIISIFIEQPWRK
jgi:hypothetical protein